MVAQDKQRVKPIDWSESSFETSIVPNNQVMPDRRVELSKSKKIVASFGRPRIDRKGRIMVAQDKQKVKPINWSESSFETSIVPNNQVMPDRRVELSKSKKIVASFGRPRIDRKGRIMVAQDKQRVKPINWSESSFETNARVIVKRLGTTFKYC
ncbi:uncharacterized protein [Montipora capricornis]